MTENIDKSESIARHYDAHKKDHAVAFALALAFGPLGLIYVNLAAAVALALGAVAATLILGPFGTVLVWIVCVVTSHRCTTQHNERLASELELRLWQ